jgi:hypothetical protein
MIESLARVMNAERMRSFEEAQCPQQFCREEYRDVRPCGKPIPLKNV